MRPIINIIKRQTHSLRAHLYRSLNYHFAKGKRVRDLSEVKITLPTEAASQQLAEVERIDYVAMREQVKSLNWEEMEFDKLCALSQQTIAFINMEIKKDKFNVEDSQFYDYSQKELHIKLENNVNVLQKLNKYYRRLYYLLTNNLEKYDELAESTFGKVYYKAEMYIMDLEKNAKLTNIIEYFINHITHPKKLELVAEPSFIKHLLSIKRELMIQGIHFENLKEQKIKQKINKQKYKQKLQTALEQPESQDSETLQNVNQEIDEVNEKQLLQDQDDIDSILRTSKFDVFLSQALKQSKYKIKIVKVMGYQYEFWVDVKHNRSKNGVEEDYVVEERQIDNPNESMLVKQKYPKIKVRYIVHKKKRKDYTMHFCIKASLLIDVSGSKKNIKVEWRGPSSSNKENEQDVTFSIIDYEGLMNGNPTIKPIFFF